MAGRWCSLFVPQNPRLVWLEGTIKITPFPADFSLSCRSELLQVHLRFSSINSLPRELLYKVSVQTSFIAPKHRAVIKPGLVYLLSRKSCNIDKSDGAAPAPVFSQLEPTFSGTIT